MQYAIYKNERLRRVLVSLLCFLVIFLMANIIVQSIHVQRVEASVALAAFLIEYGLPYLAVLLGVSGVVYADINSPDWSIYDPIEAFAGFVGQYYDDYMAYDIMNFLESFNNQGSVKYSDIPHSVRMCFLDFARSQAEAINTTGSFGYENPWVGNVVATEGTGTITVNDIPSYTGVGFQVEINRCEDFITIGHANAQFNDTDGSRTDWWDNFTINYYGDPSHEYYQKVKVTGTISPSIQSYRSLYSNPIELSYNAETGEFQHILIQVGDSVVFVHTVTNEGIINTEILDPDYDEWRFTGHTDVGLSAILATCTIVSAETGVITGDNVINDGTTWRDENAEVLEYPVIPPWVELGQETINLPVGGIDSITGEGTTVGDVTVPLDTPLDYAPDADYPYSDTLIGDVPLDIPLEIEGTWTQKLIKPFTPAKERFPFCLPWDIKNILDYFDHYEEQAPKFEFNLSEFYIPSIKGSIGFDKSLSIGLDFLDPYIPFIRIMELILADLILIMWLLRHFVSG